MAKRPVVYLHIGAPKTGTTYIQQLLWHNRDRLLADGILFPGDSPVSHFIAVTQLRGQVRNGRSTARRWRRLAEEMLAHDGVAVVSSENLAPADPPLVEAVVASLPGADVHVVYTARDLARQIPAVWQERMKNRHTVSYQDYLAGVADPARGHHQGARFWNPQDAVAVLERWSGPVPAERVHVVTLPRDSADPAVLWARFASVLGVDSARYDRDVPTANTSIGWAEAEVLLRLNRLLGEEFSATDYRRLVKNHLARHVLAGVPGRSRIELPAEHHSWVQARAKEMTAGLAAAGYDVVGSLDDLLPTSPADRPLPASGPGPDAVADSAVRALAGALAHSAGSSRRGRRSSRRRATDAPGASDGRRLPGAVRALRSGVARRGRR